MKQNMKRFFAVLCMAACLFALTACSSKSSAAADEIDPQMSMYICQVSENLLEQITGLSKDEASDIETQLTKQKQTALANGVASWVNVMSDTGAFQNVIDSAATLNEDDEYVCTVIAQFEKRKVEFKIFYTEDSQSLNPSSMSFTPKYSLGENMSRAALNTLLGMGTVFVVLVFLSLLISCFKFISIAEQKIKAKNTPVQASAQAPVSVAAPEVPAAEEEELVDDLELVAVITAAIAAATNSSTDGLVVRSIKRAPAAKWKRA
jgi:sodium pump decarboxylase gamma subunit